MLYRKTEQNKHGPTHENDENNDDDGDNYAVLQVILRQPQEKT
jgi:hypothetical protein